MSASSPAASNPTVTNNRSKMRFEITVEDQVAFAQYMLPKEKIVFTHTEVPPTLEGQGLGSALARYGLDYARHNDLVVVPLCPFIAAYIRRHPDYQSLVLPGYLY